MNKFKKKNKIKSIEEFFSETKKQLAEISLNINDSTKIDNILTKDSVFLIKSIIEKVAFHAFKIGYAGCVEHICENSSDNQVKIQVIDKQLNVNDALKSLNEFLDFNVKNIFKDVINEGVLDEESSVSDKNHLKYFLLKTLESSLNNILTELTVINNNFLPNPVLKINIDFSKIKVNKVK